MIISTTKNIPPSNVIQFTESNIAPNAKPNRAPHARALVEIPVSKIIRTPQNNITVNFERTVTFEAPDSEYTLLVSQQLVATQQSLGAGTSLYIAIYDFIDNSLPDNILTNNIDLYNINNGGTVTFPHGSCDIEINHYNSRAIKLASGVRRNFPLLNPYVDGYITIPEYAHMPYANHDVEGAFTEDLRTFSSVNNDTDNDTHFGYADFIDYGSNNRPTYLDDPISLKQSQYFDIKNLPISHFADATDFDIFFGDNWNIEDGSPKNIRRNNAINRFFIRKGEPPQNIVQEFESGQVIRFSKDSSLSPAHANDSTTARLEMLAFTGAGTVFAIANVYDFATQDGAAPNAFLNMLTALGIDHSLDVKVRLDRVTTESVAGNADNPHPNGVPLKTSQFETTGTPPQPNDNAAYRRHFLRDWIKNGDYRDVRVDLKNLNPDQPTMPDPANALLSLAPIEDVRRKLTSGNSLLYGQETRIRVSGYLKDGGSIL